MKEEKESIFTFRRKSTHRLSLHLDRKKEKKEDGQLKRASWSSFPLLRFSSSPSSSSSSSPAARGFGRKCSSSDEIKNLGNKHSPSKGNFQRGSNASIRSSVSTSSASSSSSVRTGGSSSITSILEGSGSDTFSCDSYGGNTNELYPYPVNRTSSEVIHPKRYDHKGEVTAKNRDECTSLPSLDENGGKGNTSPRIIYAHRKNQDSQHRSRKQLVKELESVRWTGSLPGGLERHAERPKTENKILITTADKTKPKHKKSFSFIHNSKFLGRLEARTRREARMCEEDVDTDYDNEVSTSCHKPLVTLHNPQTSSVRLLNVPQHSTQSQVSPRPQPPPSPRQSPPYGHDTPTHSITLHTPSQYSHESSSLPQSHLRLSEHNQHRTSPVTILKQPPPPPFLSHEDEPVSPPQYSLTAFLHEAFGSSRSSSKSNADANGHVDKTIPIDCIQHQDNTLAQTFNPDFESRSNINTNGLLQLNPAVSNTTINTDQVDNTFTETFNSYFETNFDSNSRNGSQHPEAVNTNITAYPQHQIDSGFTDTFNPRYLETGFDTKCSSNGNQHPEAVNTNITYTQHQVGSGLTDTFNPRYLETGFDTENTNTNKHQNNQEPNTITTTTTNTHHVNPANSGLTETYNPGYLETSFDSPSDFVIERNYANLIPEIRNIYHHVLLKGKDPRLPLSRSEFGELELKQNFLGVIGDTIEEEEEEEGAESESEIGELMCQVDSTCFERTMEDKLEEMAGTGREGEYMESTPPLQGEVKEGDGKEKVKKKTELRLKLVKPENNMVKRVQRSRLLRHISEESEAINSAGEEEVEMRTPSTPRSPAIDIDNAFEQKQREIDEDTDEMSRLRDLTAKLQLTTRRPSYLDWAALLKERGKRVGEALATHAPTVVDQEEEEEEEEEEEDQSMNKRKLNLQTAMDWVRKELTDMRQQDQQLARQLLQLHVEVQRLRLLNSCLATSCLLEEVASGAEEARMMESSDLCDLPPDLRETFSPVLREMGLTRMNITSRRFSLR